MRLLINVFIVFHLFLITVWLFPVNAQLAAARNMFRGYILFAGLDQDYSMFAPEPRKFNLHMFALVTFCDGSTAIYSFPRLERMSLFEAAQKERYRKFANDHIANRSWKMFLPDFARYIARKYICQNNQPDLISVYVLGRPIAEPPELSTTKNINNSTMANIFTYKVQASDLQTN